MRITGCISALLILTVIMAKDNLTASSEILQSPVTYHLSFETMDFLQDDLSAKYDEPSLEQRKLTLVPGKFGKALLNANVFSREDLEKTSMSTWDLDPLLEVLCHHRFGSWKEYNTGRMEPYIWGTGRLKGDGGCVAFWARGSRTYPGYLFFQGSSSFGRHEKYLLAIELNEDNSIEAYIRDARYDYHRIISGPVWKDDIFNHVALSWDRMEGLVLFVNGEEVASNWGTDAWWATQIPGLFHMPMCGFTYDEFWIFDRALSKKEINRIMKENLPPDNKKIPEPPDKKAAERLWNTFIGDCSDKLPVVHPFDGTSTTVFSEIFPEWAGDGCVQSPYVLDGKYELAWPQDYTSFTNILGDSDFHPEKVDIRLPEERTVNYITLEGNLTDAAVLAGSNFNESGMEELFAVPAEGQLFFGAEVSSVTCSHFRIPFLKAYGSPAGYEEGLHLALTGDIRIHEAGFFNVREEPALNMQASIRRFNVMPDGEVPVDNRTGYAMKALNDLRNSRVLALDEDFWGETNRITPGPFTRLNLLSSPWKYKEAVKSIELCLRILKVEDDDFMVVRLHDPGVPARIWTTVVFRMQDFESGGDNLRVRLDCTDIKLAEGDRLWIDIAFSGNEEIQTGGTNGSTVLVEMASLHNTDRRYAEKALKPAQSDFAKIYYWYYPWTAMQEVPDRESPPTFGGYYDIVTYPLVVARTEPDNFIANAIMELALIKNPFELPITTLNDISNPDSLRNKGFTIEGFDQKSRDTSPELWLPVKLVPTDGSPEWAFYMNYYLTRYRDIVHWWADRQNPDGQVGGGWNDDVLFASRLPGVFLYTGDIKARRIFNRIFEGLERTRMFHDGCCNIVPMDYIHVDDLVRDRYEGLLFEPGDPHKMKIAMRTAWRFGKPEKTPVNYIGGNSFKYDHDLLLWYWGETPGYSAYSTTSEKVTETMKKFAPSMDEIIRFRYTEAGMFTDGAYMPGCYDVKRIQIGGNWGPYLKNLSLAVSWEEGGGPEIPRWVENATDTSFVAHFYSYDMVERNVTARLYRLKKGVYRITLENEGTDESPGMIIDRTEELRRFAHVTVPVRPERELKLTITLVKKLPEPGPLPDLAVSKLEKSDDKLRAVINNFGAASASNVIVRALNVMGQTIAEEVICGMKSARDFIPGEAEALFSEDLEYHTIHRIVVDPDNSIEEIFERNNDFVREDFGN